MDARRLSEDERFLLDDAVLEDLLGALGTGDTFAGVGTSDPHEIPAIFPSLEAAIPSPKPAISLHEQETKTSFDGEEDTSETASQASSDTAVKKKPMTNSTRVRMKQELSYLREKVVELEQQLETAKRAAAQAAATNGSHSEQENDGALANVQCSLWERVARHQRLEKQKAENKNAELRLLLEDQLKVARSLERALKKRPSVMLSTSLADELEVGLPRKRACGDNPQDPLIFARLTQRVDRSYEELAAIWRRTGFDTCKAERNESEVLIDSSNRLYLEVTTAKIVPFSMQATDRAAWACISQPTLKFMNGIYRGVQATPDTIHSNSEMWMRFGSEEAHMQMAIVTKRFEEDARVVYVLESSSISSGSRSLLQNLQIVERGWVVLEPVRAKRITNVEETTGEADAAPDSAIIQVCMRLMPAAMDDIVGNAGSGAAGSITDIFLAAFRQNLGFLFQTIENMLVEQMLTLGVGNDANFK